jgi:hypothetical protein
MSFQIALRPVMVKDAFSNFSYKLVEAGVVVITIIADVATS